MEKMSIDFGFITFSAIQTFLLITVTSTLSVVGGVIMVLVWTYRAKRIIDKNHNGNFWKFLKYFITKNAINGKSKNKEQ